MYPYIAPLAIQPFLVWLAVSLPVVLLLRTTPSLATRAPRTTLLIWIALATAIDGALRWLAPFTFEQIFLSPGANSFYTATLQHRLGSVLSDFDSARAAMPLHAQSNLPGKLIFVYALEQLTLRADVLAWITIVVSNLGALLMYRFVRELIADPLIAFYAAVLYLFVPARLFFLPLMNTVTPLFLLAFGIALLRWLNTGRALHAVAAGGALYALVLFEPLPLVTGLLFAALLVRTIWTGTMRLQTAVLHVVLMLAVFAAVAFTVQRLYGFDLVAAFASVRADAEAFNAQQRRPYDVWIRANLIEFLFGMGAGQVVLAVAALALAASRAGARDSGNVRIPQNGFPSTEPRAPTTSHLQVVVVTVSLVAVLAALDLLGLNRGEVIRLWIFLACLLQIPAAWVCARASTTMPIALVLTMTLLQASLGMALIGFVMP